MPNQTPYYLALNGDGYEYIRKARIVSELPSPEARRDFLQQIKTSVEKTVGFTCERLFFGVPLYQSFGMTVKDARNSSNAKLLFTQGCNIKLSIAS
jgi:hypothetical protein